MTGWTTRELARQTGIPGATLASWVGSGLIIPEHYGRGRGGHLIGISGLLELLAVIELRHAGFSVREIHRAVEHLHALSGHARPLARLTLVVQGTDITWKDNEEISGVTISALHVPGQRLMVFPLGEMHANLLHTLQERQIHLGTNSFEQSSNVDEVSHAA